MPRLSTLVRNLTIYGLGDVATSVVSFLLLPIYVRHLSPEEYGIIGLLLSVEVVAKIVFRFGLDASFMRLYFDCPDHPARQRLASTLFWFLFTTSGILLVAALALAPRLAAALFGVGGYTLVFQLTLVHIFVMGFSFLPFHVLRIENRSGEFIALTFTRSVGTLASRLALVVGLGMGVLGVVLADVVISVLVTLALLRMYAPLVRPVFSLGLAREALAFGLPRLPHGLAHQVIAVADRYVLRLFVPLAEIGIYSIGVTFGLAMKLFLSAFEYAWAPFYFAAMREPDAKATFRQVTTYGVMVLVFLTVGLSVVAADVVRAVTVPGFYGAGAVVPWIALGVMFQGVYLLTSIGLNITKNTRYYPVSTGLAAAASVGANLALVPRFGILGAAWANAAAYAVLAGSAFWFSQRVYPMTYEYARLAKVAGAGAATYVLVSWITPHFTGSLVRALLGGILVVTMYPTLLTLARVWRPGERARMRQLAARVRRRRAPARPAETSEAAGEIVAAPLLDESEGVELAGPAEPETAGSHVPDPRSHAR
jgi:O-antigen/teichoic acid export membrane protein